MRITNNMLTNNFLSDMQNNLQNMQKLQQQMTSGKIISKPSDDPVIAARSMELNSQINANTQYNSNINDTQNWLSTTDTTLGQVDNSLQRIQELLVSAGNAAYGSDEKQSIKDEINQVIGGLSQTLNTNFDGKYLFGGTRGTDKPTMTTTDPVSGNTILAYSNSDGTELKSSDPNYAMEYAKINKKLTTEISQGITVQYSLSATDIMKYTDSTTGTSANLQDLLKAIVNHLDGKNADGSTVTSTDTDPSSLLNTSDLQGITDAINNVLKLRSEVGAKENRMTDAQNNNETQNENLTTILSKTEDIDITQKTMEYATAQTVYMASLQTGAKVIQPTLLDYL